MEMQRIYDLYHYWMEEKADLRTRDFFLVSSPYPMILILAFYAFFCKILGPWLMRNREPFELKYVILVYNAFQVLVNFYVLSHARLVFTGYFNPLCIPLDYSDHPIALTVVNLTYIFYLDKYTELLDTVFMVLRKKERQISFFHIVHHSSVVVALWIGCRYLSSGNGVILGVVNSATHVVMYSYYFIAALGPEYQKYLWWKRHVTHVQITQLVLVFLQAAYGILTGCSYPAILNFGHMLGTAFFLNQFRIFYFSNYIAKKGQDKAIDEKKTD